MSRTHLIDEHVSGDLGAARQGWQEALTMLDELDHPEAEAVRAKLQWGAPSA